ncbi:MAG: MMPL family transporter [Parvularculaceae bacterium]
MGSQTEAAENSVFRKLAQTIVRHRRLVIAFYIVMTGVFVSLLPALNVIVDNEKILPQDHPYVRSTDAIERTFGFKQTAVILISASEGDALEPWFLDGLSRATDAVRRLEGVRESSVLSLTADRAKAIEDDGSGLLRVRQLVEGEDGYAPRQTILARLQDWPVFDPVLISKDRKSAAIVASFANDPLGFEHQVAQIETALKSTLDPRQTFRIGGHPSYIAAIEGYSGRVGLFFGLAVILIGVLHYDAFRTWQGVALPIGTGMMAVIWVMGLLSILHLPLDSFNATAPLFIFAVAAGHSVQLLKRYYEELASVSIDAASPQAANHEAIVRSLTRVGPVLLAAGLVGAGSFLSLLAFSVETIRTFGVVIALGILSAVVIELGFMSAVRASFLPRKSPSATVFLSVRNRWDRIAAGLADIALNHRRPVFVMLAAVVSISIGGLVRLEVDNSYLRYFSADTPVRKLDEEIKRSLAGASALYVMLDTGRPDGVTDPKAMAALCALQAVLNEQPAVNKTLSFCDYMRRIDSVMAEGAHDDFGAGVPDELAAQYLQLYRLSGGPEDLDYLIDSDAQRAVVIAFRGDDSSALFLKLEQQVRAAMLSKLPPGASLSFGGNVAISVALNDTMVQGKVVNMAQIAAILCLLSALLFRSLAAGLMVVAPLSMTVLVVLGVMGLFQIPLQLVTVSIAATAVGIGSDYAIYWLYRFREELAKQRHVPAALNATFRSAGQAVMYVATSVTCGYAMLMLSPGFHIHFWLGLMVSLSMAIAAIATLTMLPALALWLRPKFLFGCLDEAAPPKGVPLEDRLQDMKVEL